MNYLQKSLQTLGLGDKESAIYLALLELGEGSVIHIAKRANLKRTTVYNLLPDMIQSGLVATGIKRKRRYYFIEDVRQLSRNLEQKKSFADKIIPELAKRHNVLEQKPLVTFYEGVGGMKELYQDTLNSFGTSGGEILSYTGLSDFYQLMPYEYYQWYVTERVRRKIKLRVIAYDSKATKDWQTQAQKDLREVKTISSKGFIFNADTEIYANKVALISYRENFMGVIIESKEINDMQRSAFEVMWKSLP
jgi:sugar-specific transcriptional regulator TrmB